MKLSVVMPAQNEEGSVGATVEGVAAALEREEIDYEVLSSTTAARTAPLRSSRRSRRPTRVFAAIRSHYEKGFGMAIRAGLDVFEGDAVAIVMADASDDPDDLVRYHRLLEDGWDCAFGSRFVPGAEVHDYPPPEADHQPARQLVHPAPLPPPLQRHHQRLQGLPARGDRDGSAAALQALQPDRRAAAEGDRPRPLLRGRSHLLDQPHQGMPKLAMKEMGSRYLFIVLYVWLESTLSRGDYQVRPNRRRAGRPPSRLCGRSRGTACRPPSRQAAFSGRAGSVWGEEGKTPRNEYGR